MCRKGKRSNRQHWSLFFQLGGHIDHLTCHQDHILNVFIIFIFVILYFICHVRKSSLSDHWPQMHLLSGTLYMQDLIGQTKHLRTVHDRETSTIWALPAARWTFSWFLHLHRERDATCSRWAWSWILLYWYRMMCGWWYMCMCWRMDISRPCG